MRVTDAIWSTNMYGCVGIVLGVDDLTGEHKAFIGAGLGASDKHDTELVRDYGNPLSLETVLRIATHLEGGKKEAKKT